MLTLQTILDHIELKVLTDPVDFSEIEIHTGYTSDLLSCVMTGAQAECIWITLIANINVVAVASLLEIPAVIITENAHADAATIARANQEGIVLLSTPVGSYQIVGRLWELGIKDTDPNK